MQPALSETQLDAMRELANIGSGTAATALSSLIGLPVELDVPRALLLCVADAVDLLEPRDAILTAIAIPAVGELDALALILMPPGTVETLCRLLGVDAEAEIGASALCEIGNVLGSSYLGALSAMTGLQLQPGLPERVVDMLGAILQSALIASCGGDAALLLESKLNVAGLQCAPAFLFIPSPTGVDDMLTRLGVGS